MYAILICKIFTGLARVVSATTAFKVFAVRVSRTWFTVDSGVGRTCSHTTSWGQSSTASTPSPRNATRSAWTLTIINEYRRQVCKDRLIHIQKSLSCIVEKYWSFILATFYLFITRSINSCIRVRNNVITYRPRCLPPGKIWKNMENLEYSQGFVLHLEKFRMEGILMKFYWNTLGIF